MFSRLSPGFAHMRLQFGPCISSLLAKCAEYSHQKLLRCLILRSSDRSSTDAYSPSRHAWFRQQDLRAHLRPKVAAQLSHLPFPFPFHLTNPSRSHCSQAHASLLSSIPPNPIPSLCFLPRSWHVVLHPTSTLSLRRPTRRILGLVLIAVDF